MSQISNHPTRAINLAYCSYVTPPMDVRVARPLEAIRMHGGYVRLTQTQIGFMSDVIPDAPKIIVVQRCMNDPKQWPNVMKQVIKRGWLLVVERDDYPITPVKTNAARWKNSMQWEIFTACHAVQTTTEPLRDLFRQYNPEVALFPNQFGTIPTYMNRKNESTRLFFGAFNRREAWEPLIDVFNRVLSRHEYVSPVVVHDKAFFDALKSNRKIFSEKLDYETYLQCLVSCDIALLPLNDSFFNQHKSDVKFIEAGACRTAVIASPTVYSSTIEDGRTGLIADTPHEWEKALESLVVDKPQRERLARNAFEYVMGHRLLVDHITSWIDWYYDLWDRREELTAALLERHPEYKP